MITTAALRVGGLFYSSCCKNARVRPLLRSLSRTSSSSSDQAFYHVFEPPNTFSSVLPTFAVSFLPEPPLRSDSLSVLGWLPALENAGLNDFTENPNFRLLLHKALRETLQEDGDEIQRNMALQLGSGWMHLYDERNIPDFGRIGNPEDIIASVLVEDSRIVPSTYEPMPAYRVCTTKGLTQLTPGFKTKLAAMLHQFNNV